MPTYTAEVALSALAFDAEAFPVSAFDGWAAEWEDQTSVGVSISGALLQGRVTDRPPVLSWRVVTPPLPRAEALAWERKLNQPGRREVTGYLLDYDVWAVYVREVARVEQELGGYMALSFLLTAAALEPDETIGTITEVYLTRNAAGFVVFSDTEAEAEVGLTLNAEGFLTFSTLPGDVDRAAVRVNDFVMFL